MIMWYFNLIQHQYGGLKGATVPTWGNILTTSCLTAFHWQYSINPLLCSIIIKNISPRKLIQEPQMRSCSSHLSNKNVLSIFRNESKLTDGSFILAGRSFQIVGPQTLNDLAIAVWLVQLLFFIASRKWGMTKCYQNR